MMKNGDSCTALPWTFGVMTAVFDLLVDEDDNGHDDRSRHALLSPQRRHEDEPAIVAPMFGIMSSSPAITPRPSA